MVEVLEWSYRQQGSQNLGFNFNSNEDNLTTKVLRNEEKIGAVLDSPESPFPLSSLRRLMVPYHSSILKSHPDNESFIVTQADEPVCCVYRMSHLGRLSYFDQPFRIELSKNFSREENPEEVLQVVFKELWETQLESSQMYVEIPIASESTNPLLERLLPLASSYSHYVEVRADLRQSREALQRGLRKSHKQSISQAQKKLDGVEIYFGEVSDEAFEAYRSLHLLAAGRETRPKLSWELQKRAILTGQASLVTLTYRDRVIGAAFFWLTRSAGLYGSAAYDRSMFAELPVSHLGIFRAIEHAQDLGIERIIFGEAYCVTGTPKEKGIATFKRGFSPVRDHFHRLLVSQ